MTPMIKVPALLALTLLWSNAKAFSQTNGPSANGDAGRQQPNAASTIISSAIISQPVDQSAGQRRVSAKDAKREVSSLVARARRSIVDGQWETAEKLLVQAESYQVKFGWLYFGDTPAKARVELERRRPVTVTAGGAPRPIRSVR